MTLRVCTILSESMFSKELILQSILSQKTSLPTDGSVVLMQRYGRQRAYVWGSKIKKF